MTYDLANIPLDFDNKRERLVVEDWRYVTIVFAAIIGIIIDWNLVDQGIKDKTNLILLGFRVILPWLVIGGLFFLGKYLPASQPSVHHSVIPSEVSTLCIDQTGVHVAFGDDKRNYLWTDIRRVRMTTVTVNAGRSSISVPVVQIVRKGQVLIDPDSDVIDGSFGPSASQLCELINQGVQKWGGPQGDDLPPL